MAESTPLEAQCAELRERVAALEAERLELRSCLHRRTHAVPVCFSRDGAIVGLNDAYALYFGHDSRRELLGRPTRDQIAPSGRPEFSRIIAAGPDDAPAAPSHLDTRGLRKDGGEFPLRVQLTRVELPDGPVTALIPEAIPDPGCAEGEALSRCTLLQKFLDSSESLSFAHDLTGRCILANQSLERLFGCAPGSLIGRTRQEAFPDMPEAVAAEHRRNDVAVAASGRPIEFEERNSQTDGEHVYRSMKFPILDVDGKVVAVGGISNDITDRKRAERALRDERERLRTILDTVGDPIFVKDDDHRITLANRAFERMFGLPPGAAIGKTLAEHVPPEERAHFLAIDRHVLDTGEASVCEESLTLQGSEPRTIITTKVRLVDESGARFIVGTIHDVTELKAQEEDRTRLQLQLHHAQKMEAIGTLAGGVAHDFNNILAGLLSGLSLLELDLEDAGALPYADIQEMKDLVQRGAEVSRQLLSFSRRSKYDVAPREAREITQKTAALFGRTRRDITIELDFAPDLDWVLVDHAQLEQLLLNLFINASHAMPTGGRLVIRGENARFGGVDAESLGAPGRFVKLVVSDTGTGIDPAVLPRIFEPFFTTKAPGQGTGLGLASVYGIVKDHGGTITVTSELGHGTSFTILLPAADRPAADRPAPPVAQPFGRGTVLIVDDEELLLRLSVNVLQAMGYHVLAASGGRAAVELVRRHGDAISLIILDMTMPEMSGAATFEAIRAIAPTMKILLASGYSIDGQAQALLDRGCDGFIQKPFDLTMLSAKLRAIA